MQAFNNMASSGLVTRKFTRYRANTQESTSYMTETVCHPARSESRMVTCGQFDSASLEIAVLYFQPKTESYRNRIVSMRSVSNFLLEFENKTVEKCCEFRVTNIGNQRSGVEVRCVAGEMDQNEMSKLMIFRRLEKMRMTCTR